MPAYYVDSNKGKDSNPGGSPALAWKSLARASRQEYRAGDQLLLKRGGLFKGSLSLKGRAPAGRPILLSGYGEGPRPVVQSGMKTAIGAAAPISGWRISGLELRGLDYRDPRKGFKRGSGGGIVFSQAELCESLVIEDCLIHDFAGPGILLHATGPKGRRKGVFLGATIEHCEIYHCSSGLVFDGTPHYYTDYFPDFRVRRVTTHDIATDGITPFCGRDGVVEHCTAYRTGLGPTRRSPVGIWFAWNRDCVIRHSESFDNHCSGNRGDGGGFDIDGGCTGCVLEHNYSHGNQGAGYLLCSWDRKLWPSTDCVCRHNLSVNDGLANGYGAIEFWQADRFKVHNNTCVTFTSAPLKFISETQGHLIKDNLFVVLGNADASSLDSWYGVEKNRFQGNLWWRGRGDLRFTLPQSQLGSLEQFAKRVGAKGEIFADPQFVNPALGDFRLKAGSPAKGKGAQPPKP